MTLEDKLSYFEETGDHFIALLERKDPHRTVTARKIIRENMMKVEHELTAKADLRSYPALWRANQIAFDNHIDQPKFKDWIIARFTEVTGAGAIAGAVLLLAVSV